MPREALAYRAALTLTISADAIDIDAAPWLGDVGLAAFYRQIAQMDPRYTEAIEPQYTPRSFPVQIIRGADDA